MSLYLDVIRNFNDNNIRYLVVGGFAVVLHGYTRVTADLDVVLFLEKNHLVQAMGLLKGLGFLPRIPVDPEDFTEKEIRDRWVREKGLTVFSMYHSLNPIFGVDIFVEYPLDFEEMCLRSVEKDLGGVKVKVCSIDHLIEMKNISGRPKDLEDVRALEVIKNVE